MGWESVRVYNKVEINLYQNLSRGNFDSQNNLEKNIKKKQILHLHFTTIEGFLENTQKMGTPNRPLNSILLIY
jgi:hypothetical protein